MSESTFEDGDATLDPPSPALRLRWQWRHGQGPRVEEFLARAGELPPADLVAVLRVDQRERWRRGERVPAEAYLQRHPRLLADAEAVLDLVYGEFVMREQLGEEPAADEYLRRFPAHEARLRRLFAVDRALLAPPPAAAAPPPAVPAAIGKYPVVSVLDRGGQALVYRAVHPTLQKDVVIKLGKQAFGADPAGRNRLLEEGRILAGLDHPHLAHVHDLDFHQDRPFLVLQYVRGRTLEQYARQETPSPRQAAGLVAAVARALAAAHRRGITHRDVKPKNVLIDEGGQPRLIDFGLAWLQDAWGDASDEPGSVS